MHKRTLVLVGIGCLAAGAAAWSGGAEARVSSRTEAKIELGRRLFLDPTVSRGGKFSCASCHLPDHGFSDPRVVSRDENGPTARHSQTLIDLGGEGFHWDGEFDHVGELLLARLGSPIQARDQAAALHSRHFEASLSSGRNPDRSELENRLRSLRPPYYGPVTPNGPVITPTSVVARLTQDDRYAKGMRLAFGSDRVDTQRLIDAMLAYMESIKSMPSKLDAYLRGDEKALTASQERGLELFMGKANCSNCHSIDRGGRPALSDGGFHNTGVASQMQIVPAGAKASTDQGRRNMSFVADDHGSFKTPPLWDVARRPPYMHDGSLKTLKQVVQYYNQGGTPNVHLDPSIKPLMLTERQVEDVAGFLESLSGEERPGLGGLPRYRAKRHQVKIVDLRGNPMKHLRVRIVPYGDRLRGTERLPDGSVARTSAAGILQFGFPASTQVVLEAKGYDIGWGRPLPDWMGHTTLIATPWDQVSIQLFTKKGSAPPPSKLVARPRLPNGSTDGTMIVFKRVRTLGRHHALYATPADLHSGVHLMNLFLGGDAKAIGTYEVDFDGGASEPVDMRALPVTPVNLKVVQKQREKRANGGQRPEGTRKGGVTER